MCRAHRNWNESQHCSTAFCSLPLLSLLPAMAAAREALAGLKLAPPSAAAPAIAETLRRICSSSFVTSTLPGVLPMPWHPHGIQIFWGFHDGQGLPHNVEARLGVVVRVTFDASHKHLFGCFWFLLARTTARVVSLNACALIGVGPGA